jgi:hypothetical protein
VASNIRRVKVDLETMIVNHLDSHLSSVLIVWFFATPLKAEFDILCCERVPP